MRAQDVLDLFLMEIEMEMLRYGSEPVQPGVVSERTTVHNDGCMNLLLRLKKTLTRLDWRAAEANVMRVRSDIEHSKELIDRLAADGIDIRAKTIRDMTRRAIDEIPILDLIDLFRIKEIHGTQKEHRDVQLSDLPHTEQSYFFDQIMRASHFGTVRYVSEFLFLKKEYKHPLKLKIE